MWQARHHVEQTLQNSLALGTPMANLIILAVAVSVTNSTFFFEGIVIIDNGSADVVAARVEPRDL
ncbi:MAG: hypothetical protein QXT06_06400 [Candidatus Bathyarchaeia archaeon]